MTNHKDEAEELLAGASPSSVDPDFAHWYLARAQVHATLALAEQQHIANILGYLALPESVHNRDSVAYNHVDDFIGEALGLNEKEEK